MEDISLYIHLPYCIKKCPYCDFNSYAVNSNDDLGEKETNYTKALLSEIKYYSQVEQLCSRNVVSIFFGGGTPSLFSAKSFSLFIESISKNFKLSENVEITLEANPGSIFEPLAAKKLSDFRDAGINRISLGCQSFSDSKLSFLGRVHSAEQSEAAIKNIRGAGFENINLDLMFGSKGETLEEWSDELDKALSFKPEHISAYGLTIEPGTDFGKAAKKGKNLVCDENTFAEMYKLCDKKLSNQGLKRYEISNYSKEGRECIHNLSYWSRKDYLGLGAGAHSFLNQSSLSFLDNEGYGIRWINEMKPENYISKCNKQSFAEQRREILNKKQAITEHIFINMRKTSGMCLKNFSKLFHQSIDEKVIANLKEQGLLEKQESLSTNKIALSKKGFLYSDYVFGELSSSATDFSL